MISTMDLEQLQLNCLSIIIFLYQIGSHFDVVVSCVSGDPCVSNHLDSHNEYASVWFSHHAAKSSQRLFPAYQGTCGKGVCCRTIAAVLPFDVCIGHTGKLLLLLLLNSLTIA